MSARLRSRIVPAAELAAAGLVLVTLLVGCSEQQPADRQTTGRQPSGEQSKSASGSAVEDCRWFRSVSELVADRDETPE